MKFRVTGADRETGEEVELVVDADDEGAAVGKANRRGLLVSKCDLATTLPAKSHTTGPSNAQASGPTPSYTGVWDSSNPGPAVRTCANCGRQLGKLEKLFRWSAHEVCGRCFQQLHTEPQIGASALSRFTPPSLLKPTLPPSLDATTDTGGEKIGRLGRSIGEKIGRLGRSIQIPSTKRSVVAPVAQSIPPAPSFATKSMQSMKQNTNGALVRQRAIVFGKAFASVITIILCLYGFWHIFNPSNHANAKSDWRTGMDETEQLQEQKIAQMGNHDDDAHAPSPVAAAVTSAADTSGLPTIRVVSTITNGPESAMDFSGWHLDSIGSTLIGNAVWSSGQVDAITYTVTVNGVIKENGSVDIPGGTLQRNVPIEASMYIGLDDHDKMTVTIQVME